MVSAHSNCAICFFSQPTPKLADPLSSSSTNKPISSNGSLVSSISSPTNKPGSTEICSLCGSNFGVFSSQSVNLDGEDVSCDGFSWIFIFDNVLEGSDRCLNYRAQFSSECCYPDAGNKDWLENLGLVGSSPTKTPTTYKPTSEWTDSWHTAVLRSPASQTTTSIAWLFCFSSIAVGLVLPPN